MKFLPSQLMYLLEQREGRRNLRALLSYVAMMVATVGVFSVLFHVIMLYEGQQHSWLTGVYWSLTVMSTLGFGDITFESDLGRTFSLVVLLSGIVLLLIVLPFVFIRSFYAPWLEAQMRLRAPREVPEDTSGHVVICSYDESAQALIPRLEGMGVPYFVTEGDAGVAAGLDNDGVSVICGYPAASETLRSLRIAQARGVFANLGDADNTNVTLNVRQFTEDVPIAATVEEAHSVDVLELAGATHTLAIKYRLGEHLANRVAAGTPQALRVGRFEDLVIAEFPIEQTSLPGRTIRDTRLRELTGLNIVGVWEQGELLPALPDRVLTEHSVPVIVGTEEQMTELDALFVIYQPNEHPVVVIGGGKVGRATVRALKSRGVLVTVIDDDPRLESRLAAIADRVVIGNASHVDVVMDAGVGEAPSVVLTTNDDATNIFLAVYCRRLNADAHISCRITHDWNLEAVYRAGADFALSSTALVVQSVLSIIGGRELVVMGAGTEVFVEKVPPTLAGKNLAESGIGAETGLNVIALHGAGATATHPTATTELPADAELVMVGTLEQRARFAELFGD